MEEYNSPVSPVVGALGILLKVHIVKGNKGGFGELVSIASSTVATQTKSASKITNNHKL
jgi:hypothetical protein